MITSIIPQIPLAAIWVLWVCAVAAANLLLSKAGLLRESSFLEKIARTYLKIFPPGPTAPWTNVFLAAGVGLSVGAILLALRSRDGRLRAFWGLMASLSLSGVGNILFWRGKYAMMLAVWATSLASALVTVSLSRKLDIWRLDDVPRQSIRLPLALMILLILPISGLNICTQPPTYDPFSYPIASTLMFHKEQPQVPILQWFWTWGNIEESYKSPFHMIPLMKWCDLAGISMGSIRRGFLVGFLATLPILYWVLERLAGRVTASLALLLYSLNTCTLATSRMMTNVSSTLLHSVLCFAAMAFCLKSKRPLRWLPCGILMGAGFFYYAPSRLMLILFWAWLLWDVLLERNNGLRRLSIGLLATATASCALVPNIMHGSELKEVPWLSEDILNYTTRPDFMQRMLGPEVNPPFTIAQRGLACIRNAAIQSDRFLERLVAPDGTGAKLLLLGPGTVLLGLCVAVVAPGAPWKRWLLPWFGISIMGPLLAVSQVDLTRLVLLHAPSAILTAIPYAVCAGLTRSVSSRWKRAACLASFIGVVSLPLASELSRTLARFSPPISRAGIIGNIVSGLKGPVYIVDTIEPSMRDVIFTQSFQRRVSLGSALAYVQEDALTAFAEDVRTYGLEGDMVCDASLFARSVDSGLFCKAASDRASSVGPLKVARLSQLGLYEAPSSWDAVTLYPSRATEACGVRDTVYDPYPLSTAVVFSDNGPLGTHPPCADDRAHLAFDVSLAGPHGNAGEMCDLLISVQYSLQAFGQRAMDGDLTVNPVDIYWDGAIVHSWLPLPEGSLGSSEMVRVSGVEPSREHRLELRTLSPQGVHFFVWEVIVYYRKVDLVY